METQWDHKAFLHRWEIDRQKSHQFYLEALTWMQIHKPWEVELLQSLENLVALYQEPISTSDSSTCSLPGEIDATIPSEPLHDSIDKSIVPSPAVMVETQSTITKTEASIEDSSEDGEIIDWVMKQGKQSKKGLFVDSGGDNVFQSSGGDDSGAGGGASSSGGSVVGVVGFGGRAPPSSPSTDVSDLQQQVIVSSLSSPEGLRGSQPVIQIVDSTGGSSRNNRGCSGGVAMMELEGEHRFIAGTIETNTAEEEEEQGFTIGSSSSDCGSKGRNPNFMVGDGREVASTYVGINEADLCVYPNLSSGYGLVPGPGYDPNAFPLNPHMHIAVPQSHESIFIFGPGYTNGLFLTLPAHWVPPTDQFSYHGGSFWFKHVKGLLLGKVQTLLSKINSLPNGDGGVLGDPHTTLGADYILPDDWGGPIYEPLFSLYLQFFFYLDRSKPTVCKNDLKNPKEEIDKANDLYFQLQRVSTEVTSSDFTNLELRKIREFSKVFYGVLTFQLVTYVSNMLEELLFDRGAMSCYFSHFVHSLIMAFTDLVGTKIQLGSNNKDFLYGQWSQLSMGWDDYLFMGNVLVFNMEQVDWVARRECLCFLRWLPRLEWWFSFILPRSFGKFLLHGRIQRVVILFIQIVEKVGAVVYTLVYVWIDIKVRAGWHFSMESSLKAVDQDFPAEILVVLVHNYHQRPFAQRVLQWKEKPPDTSLEDKTFSKAGVLIGILI